MNGFNNNNFCKVGLLAAVLILPPLVFSDVRAQEPIPLPPDQREPAEAEPSDSAADSEAGQTGDPGQDDQPETADDARTQQPVEDEPQPAGSAAGSGETAEQTGQEPGDEAGEEGAEAGEDAADEAAEQAGEQTGERQTTGEQSASAAASRGEETAQAQDQAREPRGVKRLGDSVSTGAGWSVEIPEAIQRAAPVEPLVDVRVPDQALNDRLQEVLVALARDADNTAAQNQLDAIVDQIGSRAANNIDAGRFQTASAYLDAMRILRPERSQLDVLGPQLEQARQIASLLEQGEAALAQGRLIEPPEDNARDLFQQVLELDDGNQAASDGLAEVRQALVDRALSLGGELEFAAAGSLLDAAETLPGDASVADARRRLNQLRGQHATELQDTILRRIDAGEYEAAARALDQLANLGGYSEQVRRLRSSLTDARTYGGFMPGQVFQDSLGRAGASGPEMVVMPAGSFMMGAPPNQEPRSRYQLPYHQVRFSRGFAVSRAEVTVGQFREFVEATGYVTDAERGDGSTVYVERSGNMREDDDADWRDGYRGRDAEDEMPVVHVSWNDARAYAEWLASVTGRSYRLPSEAEFEYALRGGTRTMYWWGNGSPPRDNMTNLTGDDDTSDSGRSWNEAFDNYTDGYWGPAPVASFEPNPFGLYDMIGNVREWTLDCWHSDYEGAPADGSAWVDDNCGRRVVRGGDWASTPAESFSSVRLAAEPDSRMPRVGFRVAREL